MGTISVLSDILASQVAAGEVVDRPASVVKELVENSIDAGAERITLEFQRGGVGLLRVTDDGSGMDRSDALLCLERHATSKIHSVKDLMAVQTLGFRGEALPSIASVARFRLVTRQRPQEGILSIGTEIEVHGGKVIEVKESGEAYGTRIEVRDLFYNVPARRKFLKGEQTEAAHIIQQFQILAVAHPEIAFTCLRDGREIFRLAATSSLAVRLQDLYGATFLNKMTEVSRFESHGITVYGFFSRPGEGRPDRSQQQLFINGRIVRSNLLSQALRSACDGILAKGQHPLAVLFFEFDPTLVDCNVHPAKREVRFQQPAIIQEVALQAAQRVMGNFHQEMNAAFLLPKKTHAYTATISPVQPWLSKNIASSRVAEEPEPWKRSTASQAATVIEVPAVQEETTTFNEQKTVSAEQSMDCNASSRQSPFRYIGRLCERYILLEEDAGLVLLEIKAALERLTYDQFQKTFATGSTKSQRLLMPEIIEVSPAEASWIEAHQTFLATAGLEIELFGTVQKGTASQSIKVDAIPALLHDVSPAFLLHQLMSDLQKEISQSTTSTRKKVILLEDALIRSVSRMVAQAARFPSGEAPVLQLLQDLWKSSLPYSTPSGSPTMIQFSEAELRRKFR